MQNELTVLGIQADFVWENPPKNRAFFEEKITASPKGTDLVVLPEMFTTGFTMNPKKVAEKMNGETVLWMQKMAKKHQIALVGSLVVEENKNYYNLLLFVHPSMKIEKYDKRHSFSLAGENTAYTCGTEKLIVNFKGWKICPFICYDLRFPVWTRNSENYDLLIFVANWPVKRIRAWDTLLKAIAIENMSYVIGINRTGKDLNNYNYSGNSLVVNFLGEALSSLKEEEVGIVKATLVKTAQEVIRKRLGFLNDRDVFKITNL